MKKSILLLVACCLLLLTGAYAQYTICQVRAGSGSFYYHDIPERGVREPYYSMFNYYPPSSSGYANEPRGDHNGFSYQFGLELQRVTRYHFIFGFGVMYESRTSRKDIRYVYDVAANALYSATGTCSLHNNLVFVSPMVGYELPVKKIRLHFTTGFDLSVHNAGTHEISSATITTSGQQLHTDTHWGIGDDRVDARVNFRAEALRGCWGISLGYALGIANEDGGSGFIGIGTGAGNYSRFLEMGVVYQVRLPHKKQHKAKNSH